MMINLFGLIGYPLSHSLSEKYFTEKFSRENLTNCEFRKFSIPDIQELNQLLLKHQGELKGFAVTIPHKQSVLEFLHENNIPEGLNACNCVVIKQGKLIGYNTDYIGFKKSFQSLLQPHHAKALVLGNGGAAKAVIYSLGLLGIEYKMVSRKQHADFLTYDTLTTEIMEAYPVIINTTPLGTFPEINTCPDIPYQAITDKHYCYDLVYNPSETLFLKKAKANGAIVKNGEDMFTLQAEENWKLWSE